MKQLEKQLTVSDFVHLHNHTHYSVLDGLTKIPSLISAIKDFGMKSVAITDHGTMGGIIEFYTEAISKEIKPILGIETYLSSRSYLDKESGKDKLNYHLTVLAMNQTGYSNLMRLSTIANLEGFYYRPRIDFGLLEKYNEGLIVLSGCIGGEVADNIRKDQIDKAYEIAKKYKELFKDRYYLELQDHGHPDAEHFWSEQKKVNDSLLEIGKKLDIPCVLTCDAHYINEADKQAHEILLCVQTGSYLKDKDRMSLEDFDLHVADPKDIIKRWGAEHPELILNTRKISDQCNVELKTGKILIPKFPIPKEENEKSYLDKLVWQGLAWRYGNCGFRESEKLSKDDAKKMVPLSVAERAEYELSVINDMGFNGYFLIVQDFIKWGKDQGIVFGPGRGSAAGSIVSYALRITEIEPLRYNLMFERFLNPGRISMPDIDIDIQDTRRDEVIAYCINKYGKDRVANIVTFGKMAARNAVRDVARVLEVPYSEADRLAKMIPPPVQGRHVSLSRSLKTDQQLSNEYKNNETAKKVFDLAIQLEGTIRSHGVHAAGVVIAPDDLFKYTPLELAQKGVIATQYSMGPIEELGLLKMDFLGLANLTILKNAILIVKKVYKESVALEAIPMDDELTFELLQRADTTGVFQLESSGMRRYLKELKPTLFEDIIAINALYRPGPMSEIPRFVKSKNNPSSIKYLHILLEPILKETYGVMVYQEQIIKLLQMVAGYSPGEADLVRKAIGKKKRDIMQAEEPKFIEGCIKQGLSDRQARKLWDQIQPFADYSFNKAHATCYAQISFWTAYLKAHYPAAFMAALMTSDCDDGDRLAIEISECQKMGITVLPPDINESFKTFAVILDKDKAAIRFSLSAIKNVGSNAVDEILAVRSEGQFESFEDFLRRVDPRIVNRKSLESFIKVGVFDRFHNRQALIKNLDTIMAFASRARRQADSGQTDLFGAVNSTIDTKINLNLPPLLNREITTEELSWERELLGLYLSQHPLKLFSKYLDAKTIPISSLGSYPDNTLLQIGGIVNTIREILTKKGQKMAFLQLEDLTGTTEIILFPSVYQQNSNLWVKDNVVIINGKVNTKNKDGQNNGDIKLIAESASLVTLELANTITSSLDGPGAKPINESITSKLYIKLETSENELLLKSLKQIIDNHSGDTQVILVLGNELNKQAIRLPSGIDLNSRGPEYLKQLMGSENVILR